MKLELGCHCTSVINDNRRPLYVFMQLASFVMKFITFVLIQTSLLTYKIDCRVSFTSKTASLDITTILEQNSTNELPFINYSILTSHFFGDICRTTFLTKITTTISISIVALTEKISHLSKYFAELGPIELHYSTKTYTFANCVVILLETSKQFEDLINLSSTFWSQKSRFVIVVTACYDTVNMEIAELWQKHKIYKYVLICGLTNPTLHIFRPFIPQEGRRITKVKFMKEIEDNILNGNQNLYGDLLKIALFPTSPTVIIQNGLLVGGVDFRTFQILKKCMNFSSILVRPSDGQTFTQVGKKAVGSVRDIVHGNVDVALNGHFVTDYKIDEITMTYFSYMDKVCFIVAMPGFKSPFGILIHIFTPEVWVLIAIIYFLAVMIYFTIQKTIRPNHCTYKFEDLFLHMFELKVLGGTSLKTVASSQKILIASVLISVLIFSNTFQSLLMTGLSRPSRNPFIDTLDKVVSSDLSLQSRRAESLIKDPELLPKINALRKKKLKGDNFLRLGRFSITKVKKYYNYVHYDNKNNLTEHLHTVPECVSSSYLGYVLPKNSPLKSRINVILRRIQEHGLIVKWYGGEMDSILRKQYWPVETNDDEDQSKAFTIKDLTFNFKLLGCGLAISAIVFMIEVVLGCKRSGNRN